MGIGIGGSKDYPTLGKHQFVNVQQVVGCDNQHQENA